MLWELKQLEQRRTEIETEIESVKRDRGLSPQKRSERLSELNREDTQAYVRRQQLVSLVSQDPQLSRMLDRERSQLQIKPLPEAQMGVLETPGELPPRQASDRASLQDYVRDHRQKSVTERSIENAKLLEQERGSEWEPE